MYLSKFFLTTIGSFQDSYDEILLIRFESPTITIDRLKHLPMSQFVIGTGTTDIFLREDGLSAQVHMGGLLVIVQVKA